MTTVHGNPNLSEAAFQNSVIHLAKMYGWLVNHQRPAINQSGRWSTATQGDTGFTDLVIARAGEVIFSELKTVKAPKKLPPNQELWRVALSDCEKVSWNLWTPKNWDSIETILSGGRT